MGMTDPLISKLQKHIASLENLSKQLVQSWPENPLPQALQLEISQVKIITASLSEEIRELALFRGMVATLRKENDRLNNSLKQGNFSNTSNESSESIKSELLRIQQQNQELSKELQQVQQKNQDLSNENDQYKKELEQKQKTQESLKKDLDKKDSTPIRKKIEDIAGTTILPLNLDRVAPDFFDDTDFPEDSIKSQKEIAIEKSKDLAPTKKINTEQILSSINKTILPTGPTQPSPTQFPPQTQQSSPQIQPSLQIQQSLQPQQSSQVISPTLQTNIAQNPTQPIPTLQATVSQRSSILPSLPKIVPLKPSTIPPPQSQITTSNPTPFEISSFPDYQGNDEKWVSFSETMKLLQQEEGDIESLVKSGELASKIDEKGSKIFSLRDITKIRTKNMECKTVTIERSKSLKPLRRRKE